MVLANLSGEEAPLQLPRELCEKHWKLLFSGRPECGGDLNAKHTLAPWESEVFLCTD